MIMGNPEKSERRLINTNAALNLNDTDGYKSAQYNSTRKIDIFLSCNSKMLKGIYK